jgi:hypothetical protein
MDVLYRKRIRPSVWGRVHGYDSLRRVSLSHGPGSSATASIKASSSLQKVLPCQKCRDHMAVHARNAPVPLSKGKYPFFDWTVDLHNRVNADCENRPMIRKSLGPSTNTGTDVGASVCCFHVRHHRRYPMLRTVLDVLCCTRNARMRRDMDCISFHHGRCIY